MEWYNDIAVIVRLSDLDQGAAAVPLSQNPNPKGQEVSENQNNEPDEGDDAGDSDYPDSEFRQSTESDSDHEDEDENEIYRPISPKSSPKRKRGRPPGAKNIKSKAGGREANNTDNICKICNKSFTAFSSLQRHEATTHSDNTKRFSCEHCGKKFTQKPSLVFHIKNKHTGEFDFPCPHCEKKYVRSIELKCHIKYSHDGHKRDFSSRTPSSQIANYRQKCSECGETFTHIKRHMESVHGSQKRKRKHVCSVCNKAFVERRDLNRHLGSHDKTSITLICPCPHCPKKFSDNYALRQHISVTHLVLKKYVSKYCGMKFTTPSGRNEHDKIHAKDGICFKSKRLILFACELCEERVESDLLLKIHTKKKHPKPRLVLQRMKVKNISLKEKPESGLFLVKPEKVSLANPGHPWHLCLKCGRAYLDLNKARRHNNFCEVVPVSLTTNQDTESENENDMDESESETEPAIHEIDIDLDPDPPLSLTLGDNDKPKPQPIEPEIINSDDEERMDYFDEAFGEDDVATPDPLSTIDEGHHSDSDVTTSSKIKTVGDSIEPEVENLDKSKSNEEVEPVSTTSNEPVTATASKPVPLSTILAVPKSRRTGGRPGSATSSKLPAELSATTPWQIEHMNVVLTAPKPFQCKTCLKFFGSKSGVYVHILTHEEPKFCCAFCGKRFHKVNVWRVHERTHTGEKPYKCKYCDWRTGDQNFMYIHERTHPESGKQPYKYPNKEQKEKLTCPVCKKTANSARDFQNHMYFQHEKDPSKGLPYTCTICKTKTTFAYRSNAIAHVKSTHSDEVKKIMTTTNYTSIFTHFILLDELLLPPRQSRPGGRAENPKELGEIIDDSEFQDLSHVKIT